MIRNKIAIFLSALFAVICVMSFAACDTDVGDNKDKVYTVTWKNDNGDILEIDQNVKEGSVPTYDGATPEKKGDEQYSYVFSGWDREISKIYADTVYTATYTSDTKKYTVVWKNYNGDVLKTDADIPYGTMPKYSGATPTREGTDDISYVFAGWSPSVDIITGNATYTAKFNERHNGSLILGVDPIFSDNGKTIQYGFYPQTHVSDETLISELNKLTPSQTNGWYLYNGEYYAKEAAKVYNNESYTFDDGTPIVNGSEYWFKCEMIEWQILSDADGVYFLLSRKLLDARSFYEDYSNRTIGGTTVYANNYEHSGVRNWLNTYFLNTAFALNNSYIQEIDVDNSASSSTASNPYACANTKDKVYLPGYQDCLNSDYGFDSNAADTSSARECLTTDYARARGAWCNTKNNLKYNGTYWTRSPSDQYYYCAWNVNSGGYLSAYAVDGDSHCVRPCISISFS